jgi:hypothetical protein
LLNVPIAPYSSAPKKKIESEILLDLAILAGCYLAVTFAAFVVNLFRDPALLDAEAQNKISRLSAELELPDKAQAEHLRSLIAKLDGNGVAILKLALFHEQLNYRLMESSGLSHEERQRGIHNCLDSGLLRYQNNYPDYTSPLRWLGDIYYVSPEIRAPLKRLLYAS